MTAMKFGYHGTNEKFTNFSTLDVCLAKMMSEARGYGKNIYKVEFTGKPKFDTGTLYVVQQSQIKKSTLLEK